MDAIRQLIAKLRGTVPSDVDIFSYEYKYKAYLDSLWNKDQSADESEFIEDEPTTETTSGADDGIRLSRRAPDPLDWCLAFTVSFTRAISSIDRSLQGRVLLALAEISANPDQQKGDTIKALTAEHTGLWRYRIGDYRLVYRPDAQNRMVILMDFASRGGVYG